MHSQSRKRSCIEAKSVLQPASILLTAALATASVGMAADVQPQRGSWHRQQVSFDWLGDVSTGAFYTCQGLRDELTFLLEQSGAKLNAPVQITPCISTPGGPSTLLSAQLDFSTFVPIGNPPSPQESPLAGNWRPVEFSAPRSYPQLQQGDCELVLEFQNSLLKYFTTRDMNSNLRCIPFQETQYGLAFQVFVPADTPARAVGGR